MTEPELSTYDEAILIGAQAHADELTQARLDAYWQGVNVITDRLDGAYRDIRTIRRVWGAAGPLVRSLLRPLIIGDSVTVLLTETQIDDAAQALDARITEAILDNGQRTILRPWGKFSAMAST